MLFVVKWLLNSLIKQGLATIFLNTVVSTEYV